MIDKFVGKLLSEKPAQYCILLPTQSTGTIYSQRLFADYDVDCFVEGIQKFGRPSEVGESKSKSYYYNMVVGRVIEVEKFTSAFGKLGAVFPRSDVRQMSKPINIYQQS